VTRDKDHLPGRKLRWLFIGARAQMQTLRREVLSRGLKSVIFRPINRAKNFRRASRCLTCT